MQGVGGWGGGTPATVCAGTHGRHPLMQGAMQPSGPKPPRLRQHCLSPTCSYHFLTAMDRPPLPSGPSPCCVPACASPQPSQLPAFGSNMRVSQHSIYLPRFGRAHKLSDHGGCGAGEGGGGGQSAPPPCTHTCIIDSVAANPHTCTRCMQYWVVHGPPARHTRQAPTALHAHDPVPARSPAMSSTACC